MTKDEALKLALKALKTERDIYREHDEDGAPEYILDAITSIQAALAQPVQPEQEPVACRFCHSKKGCYTWLCYSCGEIDDVQQPTPPAVQRPWQGLTDEDKQTAVWTNGTFGGGALWAEAMLKERNHD